MSINWSRIKGIGRHFHTPNQIVGSPGIPAAVVNAAIEFDAIFITIDLETVPNTEDSAVVEQEGIVITGPAWLRLGQLLAKGIVLPVGATYYDFRVYLLGEEWTGGTSEALLFASRAVSGSHTSAGGFFETTSTGSGGFIPEGISARIGVRCQPKDGADDPVAGNGEGTIGTFILMGVPVA